MMRRIRLSIQLFNHSTVQQQNPLLDTSRLWRDTRIDSPNPNAQIPNP